MYARIATFEGEPDHVDEAIEAARGQAEANWESPPEGLEVVKELWMSVDREGRRGSASRSTRRRRIYAGPTRH